MKTLRYRWQHLTNRQQAQWLAGWSAFNATIITLILVSGVHSLGKTLLLGFWGTLELVTIVFQMRVRPDKFSSHRS
ncbi:hypothetical protein SAMN00768000_3622 [Sulfobacillus thermosulfidooxidans DSM 9293]|uniref:Uncharacterized protein n=1 Tax=Sulfobacillus thermosulfidooxidans (strain DSM 9293 / VKM B-1269 / AT-1) TaxID=929705 RepID=A0A1W1WPA4_SULTA|nr:hypothetical protein [Sulfobacillus thermosulfidooxidans]SMC08056.1 hypothetical protein SAMN00768000_3622 [Sulfobacillus thermosulfidooxidans DSM 9293]